MTNSYKKTPISPMASGRMKPWKQEKNRLFRRKTKQFIHTGDFERLPEHIREVSDIWSSPSDGKAWFGYNFEPGNIELWEHWLDDNVRPNCISLEYVKQMLHKLKNYDWRRK